MSVEPVDRKSGRVWRVRWRDDQGQERSRVLGKKQDAVAFDAELKRRKRLGELDLFDKGAQSLSTFIEEWWRLYAEPNLSERTLDSYAGLWDRHVLPYLGDYTLSSITVEVVTEWVAALRAKGVGDPSIYRAMMLLSGVLQKAFEWGRVRENVVRRVPKPQIRRVRLVRPLSGDEIEKLRAQCWRHRDAAIVAFMGYAGLRPQELMALQWDDIGPTTIYVDKATSPKQGVKTTKNREARTVRIRPELEGPLAEWREFAPSTKGYVITKLNGQPFNDATWGTWHKDVWRPITEATGIDARPYDLRHTFVSKLIDEGKSVIEVAKQAGHTPTMALEVYGHVFDQAA